MSDVKQKDCLEHAFTMYRRSGREQDLEQVVRAGKRLVWHFVCLFSPKGSGEDLVQAGMEGLMKAVAGFDPGCGAGFVTYASHCIMGEIRHYIRKETSYYRLGCIAELQGRVERLMEDVLKATGEVPAVSEIARLLNVREEGVVQVMRAGLVSLDEIDLGKIQRMRYESFRLPIEDRIVLEQAVDRLSELQRNVIRLLFYRDMTQVEAAEELGISQRKVSRVLHKSLRKMAELIGGGV
jgi:RNA polymerase sigma-B factor